MKGKAIFVAALVVIPITCFSETIIVDPNGFADYTTIQEAINASVNGDTIIVSEGIYIGSGNRDIDFGGRAITVSSSDPSDPEVVTATVIDCQGSEADPHRGFKFHSGETSSSILSGITIINGYGPDEELEHTLGFSSAGGAIFCDSSSPTISYCSIVYNVAGDYGGGVNCEFGGPTIINCVFGGNSSTRGAGLFCYKDNTTITNCLFHNNAAYNGGGMYDNRGTSIITNCTFSENSAEKGGGIFLALASSTISNCILWDNILSNSSMSALAADVYFSVPYDSATLVVEYSDVNDFVYVGDSGTLIWADTNINANPLFVTGQMGSHYLSQIEAGQSSNSPCVDTGSDLASTFSFSKFPTRTDGLADTDIIDMGYHYSVEEPANFTLTISVEPNDLGIDTVNPSIGDHNCGGWVTIEAEKFIDCPDVYSFDHWEGDVADTYSAQTIVVMDTDKTVTAVFVDDRTCGDECHPNDNFGDFNNDCIIDIIDFSEFAYNWLLCTKPECD